MLQMLWFSSITFEGHLHSVFKCGPHELYKLCFNERPKESRETPSPVLAVTLTASLFICRLRLKQEENNCSETTSTVDDILISCQTGLPASFNSQSKVRRLLQTINQDSYVLPMLEARALEEDAESLVREQHHFQKTFHESQITGYKNLLEILRDAGGVEYHKLMGNPDEVATGHKKDEDFNPDAEPAALTVEKVIGRYPCNDVKSSSLLIAAPSTHKRRLLQHPFNH